MKHTLITISLLLLTSFLVSCEKKEGIVYRHGVYGTSPWSKVGDRYMNRKYEGELRFGFSSWEIGWIIPHGKGTYTYLKGWRYMRMDSTLQRVMDRSENIPEDKLIYVGEFKDGQREGQGTETSTNRSVYKGEWKNDMRNGQGTLYVGEDKFYEGEWKDGKMNGQGTLIWDDGRKYEGQWEKAKYHGLGTFTFPDGRKFIGEFKEHKPWKITYYDKDGNIIRNWVNGEKEY